jgi:hypothetical protein
VNELVSLLLLVLAVFASMSGLLYVLTVIDPQTNRATTPERGTVPVTSQG